MQSSKNIYEQVVRLIYLLTSSRGFNEKHAISRLWIMLGHAFRAEKQSQIIESVGIGIVLNMIVSLKSSRMIYLYVVLNSV